LEINKIEKSVIDNAWGVIETNNLSCRARNNTTNLDLLPFQYLKETSAMKHGDHIQWAAALGLCVSWSEQEPLFHAHVCESAVESLLHD
jgi:hypothetical protein